MKAASKVLRNGFPLYCRGSFWKHPKNWRDISDDVAFSSDRHAIRQKAQQKISEMRNVVSDFTDHVEEGIKRRQELQKKADEYLKALDSSGESITENLKDDDIKSAAAKIQEMRRLVNEFSFHNQEGIKRRMMMQEMANEYLRALDDYKLKLQTHDPLNISDTRE
uniref:Laminin subunit alpha-2 n=1 Tax=Lygus hesperus TaxID=30085 RepID=A0A0A9WNY1_LYGHE